MKMREWTTGRILEIGDNETVKKNVLLQNGWRVVEEATPVVSEPETVPVPVAPVVAGSEEVVGVEIVTPVDEQDLEDAEDGERDIAQAQDDSEPVEPVVVERKGTGRKAGRPKKSAHAWMSNLPEE